MDDINIIDSIINHKQFRSYKVISRGKFASTIEIDNEDKQKKSSVLILTKKAADIRKFYYERMENPYIVKALQFEYLCKFQSYIIHIESGENTLQDAIGNKFFRQSPDAIESIFNWIKQVSMGLKKLHSEDLVHLNIRGSCIEIFSNNIAKLGGLDFARHSSTMNKNLETGSESCYWPPERFLLNSASLDGKKFDSWCLTLLTVEALTNNYLASKTSQRTKRLKQYDALYKILQVGKFTKTVRKAYPTAANKENLDKILQLVKYTLKVDPAKRPEVSEFLILLMELIFLKDFDEQLKEDRIWKDKTLLKRLQCEMQGVALALENKSSAVTKKSYVEELPDQMIFHKKDRFVKEQHTQTYFQTDLRNNTLSNTLVQTKEKTKNKSVLTTTDYIESKPFFEDLIAKKQENSISEKRETDLMGDNISDEFKRRNQEIKDFPFEHADLELPAISPSEKKNSMFENIQKVIPYRYEKNHVTYDLRKSADEENNLTKQREDDYKQSEIKVCDIDSKDTNVFAKQAEIMSSETKEVINKNYQDHKIKSKFPMQLIFRKLVEWSLDEIFYTGVRQSGSFINTLSKTLTG